jgi:uncharacterized protein YxjI
MKYFVKQKIFTLGEKFEIYDESGIVRYRVEGAVFSFGEKFKMYDEHGNLLYQLNQELWTWLPKFILIKDGNVVASMKKKLTFFKSEYDIEQLGWQVKGDLWSHDFQIYDGSNVIATIKKEWFTLGDCYEFDIQDTKNVELVLAVILMIDEVIDMANDNN